MVPILDECLSIVVSAYRKYYSTQHVLIRLLKEWRTRLDEAQFAQFLTTFLLQY